MRANTMANSQNTSFSVTFAKQDKELAKFAPTPLRQGRQWANPHDDSITQKGGKNIEHSHSS